MSELLLELFSEEIPSRMQARAAADLERAVVDGLKAAGITGGRAQAYATPRRLVLVIDDLPAGSPAVSEERKGPRVGAPEAAIAGFLKGAGLASIAEAEIVADPKKGDFYVARIDRPGRATADILADVVPQVAARFPWPKAMRAGSSDFAWVRPMHGVLCLVDGKPVALSIGDVASGDHTRGHRFHGNEAIRVTSFEDYGRKLMAAKVLLPASERAASIIEQTREIALAAGLEWVEDEGLVAENAGLTEWPTVLMGHFDEAFLAVPAECLTTSMRTHQKCFSLSDPKTGRLANRFLLVTNLIATDGGRTIVAGNEKVIRARLSDARFFWEQDLKKKLEPMRQELAGITFHEKLGTQADRIERITELARALAGSVDAEPELAGRAAQLAKADLVSGMVGEFPELQGLMGRYYAQAEGIHPQIAAAIEEHYKPKGASDTVPTAPVAIAVSLADKLDMLIGFWAIGEKPSGSGDPFQLRRAALGVIRIVLENDLRVPLARAIVGHYAAQYLEKTFEGQVGEGQAGVGRVGEGRASVGQTGVGQMGPIEVLNREDLRDDLLAFFADRLKVYLRDKGARHDLIDAVFALPGQDDLALVVKRVEALSDFLGTDDGANLLSGAKRAANILGIEEKKDKRTYDGAPDGKLLVAPEERGLEAAIAKVDFDTKAAIAVENFAGAMRALAELRAPVDAFFEQVTVNDKDAGLRENRLKLLAQIRSATLNVADFTRIAG